MLSREGLVKTRSHGSTGVFLVKKGTWTTRDVKGLRIMKKGVFEVRDVGHGVVKTYGDTAKGRSHEEDGLRGRRPSFRDHNETKWCVATGLEWSKVSGGRQRCTPVKAAPFWKLVLTGLNSPPPPRCIVECTPLHEPPQAPLMGNSCVHLVEEWAASVQEIREHVRQFKTAEKHM